MTLHRHDEFVDKYGRRVPAAGPVESWFRNIVIGFILLIFYGAIAVGIGLMIWNAAHGK